MQYSWKRVDPGLKDVVSTHLDQWSWLLPPWIATFHIRPLDGAEGDDNESLADLSIDQYPYREAVMRVSSRLLLEPRDVQSKCILHEILHVVLAPIFTIVDKLELAAPLPTLIEEAQENVVEDLTRRVWEKELKTQ